MDNVYITKVCKMNETRRDQLHGFYRGLTEPDKVLIEEKIRDISNQHNGLRDKNHLAEYFYACRLLAISWLHEIHVGFAQKREMSDAELEILTQTRMNMLLAKKCKPIARKKRVVEARYEEIKFLRKQGASWRDVALYLEKYGKTRIAYGYLGEIFREINIENGHEKD